MTSKRRCRAILFDWDGTLVDTVEVKARNVGTVFRDGLGVSARQAESAYRRHSGRPRRELFDAIAADVQREPLDEQAYRALSDAFSRLNSLATGPDRVFPDVPPALQRLREAGFTLGVSSSVPTPELRTAVSAAGLDGRLDLVLGSEPGCGKGCGHVEQVCRLYGWAAGDLCVVGDDVADIQLAREAGTWVVARIGTRSRDELRALAPDGIVQTLLEILDFLEPGPREG